ncbi:MAG TPA: hypothetical protein PLI31_06835 [Methanoregulaceae archaeon]|nr:hypothetical protein [Methanoregulaceae archaeon]
MTCRGDRKDGEISDTEEHEIAGRIGRITADPDLLAVGLRR